MTGSDADLLLTTACGERFALPLAMVERITALPQLLPVPGAPAYLQGVMVVAGECLPVVDLARRLGLPRAAPWSLDIALLICRCGPLRAALAVDEVLGVIHSAPPDQQLAELFRGGLPAVSSLTQTPQGMALIPDVGRLIDLDLALPGSDLTLPESLLEACRHATAVTTEDPHDR